MKQISQFFYRFSVLLAFAVSVFAQDAIKYKTLLPDKSAVVPAETIEKENVPDETYLLKRGTKELQLEYGISPFNPSNFAGPKEFDVYGRHLHLFTVRFARVYRHQKKRFLPIYVRRNSIRDFYEKRGGQPRLCFSRRHAERRADKARDDLRGGISAG